MAMLPFRPTPFFEDKTRAFWNLQFAGWGGALLLRAVSGAINALDFSFFVIVVIETITGFSISLILSVLYRELINRRPLMTWGLSTLALALAVLAFASIGVWAKSLTLPESEAGFTALLIAYLIYPLTLLGTWSALYYAINFFLQVEEQADRLERLEAQATGAQLAMLRYQLNPHFLFNTLNSISTLVLLKQTEPANAMLTRLSSFLRHTLISQPGGKVTLAQEVDTLKLYLGIERMRFEERLRTEFAIEPAAAQGSLPSMLLQPLVENAIKYAVSPQEEGARISVTARLVGNRLRIAVSDTGPGLQQSPIRPSLPLALTGDGQAVSTGVGLANIRNRLAQAYGDDHLFEIRTPPEGGFTVIIELPYEAADSAEPAPPQQRFSEQSLSPSAAPPTTKRPIGTET
ncbi:sensor histidine kinase [Pelagerythrobacter marensis]|uniref:Two-component signal transduction histidine kinase n=1 Tax=Pelagerythrobacter marensis TaxID=543877 RepID=A0A0G3X9W5_9SPHN|nr:histidine kinase [Pelagerythrobacter marensis]AKM08345.1 Two-component signal transduction histidine kinase [Pelagerythrobacter marensis]